MEKRRGGMYYIITKKDFNGIMKRCRPVSIIDMNINTGNGKRIKQTKLGEITNICAEIRCYPDDILSTYDLYYEKNMEYRFTRVLLL